MVGCGQKRQITGPSQHRVCSHTTGLSKQNLLLSTQANMAACLRVWLLCVAPVCVHTPQDVFVQPYSECQETSDLKLETRIMWIRSSLWGREIVWTINSLWGGSCEPVGYLRRESREPVRGGSCEPETVWNIGHWSRVARQKGSRMAGLHLSDEGVFLVSLPGRCLYQKQDLKEQLSLVTGHVLL